MKAQQLFKDTFMLETLTWRKTVCSNEKLFCFCNSLFIIVTRGVWETKKFNFSHFRTWKYFAKMTWTPRSSLANTKNVENWMLRIVQCFASVSWNTHCLKTSVKCKCLPYKNSFTVSEFTILIFFNFLRFKREDFQRIAELIVSVFPTENLDTYFIPAQYGKPARGKLWDSYNTLRSVLASVGFIERRQRKCRPTEENNELLGLWINVSNLVLLIVKLEEVKMIKRTIISICVCHLCRTCTLSALVSETADLSRYNWAQVFFDLHILQQI